MRLPRRQFDALLENAIAALPPQFARWIDEVPIIVEDHPDARDDPENQTLLGLYQGTPLTHRQTDDSGMLPDQIHIYRRPLEDMCRTLPQLEAEIRKTLLHELGHHAGLDEQDLKNLGYD